MATDTNEKKGLLGMGGFPTKEKRDARIAAKKKAEKDSVSNKDTPNKESKTSAESKAMAERRLEAGKYGEMDGTNPAPASKTESEAAPKKKGWFGMGGFPTGKKKDTSTPTNEVTEKRSTVNGKDTPKSSDTSKTKRQRFNEAFASARKEKGAGKTFMFEGKKYTTDRADDKPKVSEATISQKPTTAAPKPETSQEAKEGSSKKRDRLFGLDFLPKIDSKEGGDKVNLPFGLGSYETLPQKEDYSKNKKGGRINRKSGGKIRKAGCKRGMGKALRGY